MCTIYAHMPGARQITLHNGRYRLQRRLGAGSFGEVWLGRDLIQATDVAIKLLAPNVTVDQFLLETQLMTRLRAHDRIATIMNVVLEPAGSFIVMEYVPNGSVEGRLATGNVSLVEAVRWTREALDALAHAHELGVVHRDVKPGNFLLDGDDRAVLSDFGIAEDTARQLLANSAIYGRHAAPELLNGGGSSPPTDIFAMGCTLYRLLTGQYPFNTAADILAGSPTDPHILNPQVPLALTRIVRMALAPNPANRYATAREMLTALTACRISYSWEQVQDPGAIATWRSGQTPAGVYEVRLTAARRGGYALVARKDRGAGFRRFDGGNYPTERGARAEMRKLLVRVVEGRLP
jgi:serine/threonine protein kinase